MPYFRKLPVVIEARQVPGLFDIEERMDFEKWVTAHFIWQGIGIAIDTLEGRMTAEPGDWVIRGVAGEFYPCKASIFAKTYERVPDDEVLTAASLEAGLRLIKDAAEEQGADLFTTRLKSRT